MLEHNLTTILKSLPKTYVGGLGALEARLRMVLSPSTAEDAVQIMPIIATVKSPCGGPLTISLTRGVNEVEILAGKLLKTK